MLFHAHSMPIRQDTTSILQVRKPSWWDEARWGLARAGTREWQSGSRDPGPLDVQSPNLLTSRPEGSWGTSELGFSESKSECAEKVHVLFSKSTYISVEAVMASYSPSTLNTKAYFYILLRVPLERPVCPQPGWRCGEQNHSGMATPRCGQTGSDFALGARHWAGDARPLSCSPGDCSLLSIALFFSDKDIHILKYP